MTISLKSIVSYPELTVSDAEPAAANVKYAQRSVDVEPVVANVKYAQRGAEFEPVVANVKYAQRNEDEAMAIAEAV